MHETSIPLSGDMKRADIRCREIEEARIKNSVSIEDLGIVEDWCRNWLPPEVIRSSSKEPIVFCNTAWLIGGVERVLTILLPILNIKYQMIMVSIDGNPQKGYPIPEEITFVSMSSFGKKPLDERLAKFIELIGAKVFVGHANVNDPYFPVYELLKEKGIRSVLLNHYNYLLPYWINECIPIENNRHKAFEYADVVLWLNNFSAVLGTSQNIKPGVLPNPIQFDNQESKTKKKRSGIVCVGRFYDLNKRVDRMLEIFSHVVKRKKDATLTLVGEYNWNLRLPAHNNMTLQEYYHSLAFPDNSVFFVGQQQNVVSYYQCSSVILLTSVLEGFPMVLCEAAMHGLPGVVYDYPGQEIIVHEQSGYVIEPDHAVEAAECIVELLDNPELWERMSTSAKLQCERYSIKSICKCWENLIDGLLAGNSRDVIMKIAGVLPVESTDLHKQIIEEEKKALRHISDLASEGKILVQSDDQELCVLRKDELMHTQEMKQRMEKQIEILKSEMEIRLETEKNYGKLCIDYKEEIARMAEIIRDNELRIEQLRKELQTTAQIVASNEKIIEEWKTESKDSIIRHEKLCTEYREEIKRMSRENEKYEKGIKELQKELCETMEMVAQKELIIEDQKKENKDLVIRYEELCTGYREEIKRMSEENKRSEERIKDLRMELCAAVETVVEKDQIIEEQRKENKDLIVRYETLCTEYREEIKRMSEENERCEERIKDLRNELYTVVETVALKERIIEEQRKASVETEQCLRQVIEEFKIENQRLTRLVQESEIRTKTLEQEINELFREKEQLRNDIDELEEAMPFSDEEQINS